MNDNYCDTSDGSDEVMTAACSHIHRQPLFQCNDHVASYQNMIPTSRVGDGNIKYIVCFINVALHCMH